MWRRFLRQCCYLVEFLFRMTTLSLSTMLCEPTEVMAFLTYMVEVYTILERVIYCLKRLHFLIQTGKVPI